MNARQPQEHWTKVDGRRVYYQRLPAGGAAARPPLLLVHGISCCTETWAPFLQQLARRDDAPEVIVPELPAHGKSEKPDRVLSMGDYGAWTERLLDNLDLPAVDIMGHSMGCQVTLALAQQFPARVRRVLLLGPTTGGRVVSTFRNFTGLLADSTREPGPYNRCLLRVFRRMGPPRYFLTVREMQKDDVLARARAISSPALVLCGGRDAIVPPHAAQQLVEALPAGAGEQLDGAPHAAQYTHPELTTDRVLRFLGSRL